MSWEVIEEQVGRTKIKRYPYKQMFGVTLTELITYYKNAGYDVKKTLKLINQKLKWFGYTDEKLFNNVKISVYARFCEQRSYTNRTKKFNKGG